MSVKERLGFEAPVVQAGMGGGIARHELAVAVSAAGGLGTIGLLAPSTLREELRAARERTSRPIAVNLLIPLARRAHWEVAREADVVVTFWGRPRRRTEGVWLHQCGSVDEARAARRAGADGVIVQGVEAGGHVRGFEPALDLLASVQAALGAGYPIWLAGGIATAADVSAAIEAGAEAAVLGTRFLMTDESRAHPAYKARVRVARETIVTDLFGAGWPAPHRVLRNRATDRWLGDSSRAPRWMAATHRITARAFARAPYRFQDAVASAQSPGMPLLSPQPPTDDGPPGLLDSGPLYAGETAARIDDVLPAGDVVRALAQR